MDGHVRTSAPDVTAHFEFALGDELRGERATLGKTLLDVQRDLRVKAAYIAAIEDSDVSAFPNPSFVPGYVRSYARYLSLDPDQIYRRFCAESGFNHAPPATPRAGAARKAAAATGGVTFELKYPLADARRGVLPEYPLSALGSLAVLVALVAGLGYGGWNVLQNIQRVQFAPVEDLPVAVAEVDPLEPPAPVEPDAVLADLASPVAARDLAELYRQQAAEVPILAPRDTPIASIDPDHAGPLALRAAAAAQARGEAVRAPGAVPGRAEILRAVASVTPAPDAETAETAPAAVPVALSVVAERAAWIRVYQENGTVIFERILETGESYAPPAGIEAPRIWAGNAGSVYVRLGERLHGPLGSGTRAVRDVVLEPAAIAARYSQVTDVPATIGLLDRLSADVAIQ